MTELKAVEILKTFDYKYESAYMADGTIGANLSDIREALSELQELTQEKSCEGCYWEDIVARKCLACIRNARDYYTPKG